MYVYDYGNRSVLRPSKNPIMSRVELKWLPLPPMSASNLVRFPNHLHGSWGTCHSPTLLRIGNNPEKILVTWLMGKREFYPPQFNWISIYMDFHLTGFPFNWTELIPEFVEPSIVHVFHTLYCILYYIHIQCNILHTAIP